MMRATCGVCGTRDATTITRLSACEPDVPVCGACEAPVPQPAHVPIYTRVLAAIRRFDSVNSKELADVLGVCPGDTLVMNRLAQQLTRLKRRGAIVAEGSRYRAV